jgi:hypothetical protein
VSKTVHGWSPNPQPWADSQNYKSTCPHCEGDLDDDEDDLPVPMHAPTWGPFASFEEAKADAMASGWSEDEVTYTIVIDYKGPVTLLAPPKEQP